MNSKWKTNSDVQVMVCEQSSQSRGRCSTQRWKTFHDDLRSSPQNDQLNLHSSKGGPMLTSHESEQSNQGSGLLTKTFSKVLVIF